MARARPLRAFLLAWLAFTAVAGLWSVLTPYAGGADEFQHLQKAAAVVRGQLVGTPLSVAHVAPEKAAGAGFSPYTYVVLPTDYASVGIVVSCYAQRPEASAACLRQPPHYPGTTRVRLYVGRYPPLYYAITGLPTLVLPQRPALVAARLVSAAAAGALLAAAFTAARVRGRPLLAFAVSAATTPQVLFFSGVLNPNGLETAAATCAWVAASLLVLDRPPPRAAGRLTALLAGALAVLVQVRALSLLWAALVVALVLLAAGPRRARELLTRRTLAGAAAAGLSAAAALVWLVTQHSLALLPDPPAVPPTTAQAAAEVLDRTPAYARQLVGVLGSLDTPVPRAVLTLWALVVGLLVVRAVRAGGWPGRAALALLVALMVAVPVGLTVLSVDTVGYAWQGRYLLPLAVGLPLLAAALAERARPAGSAARVVPLLAGLLLVAEVVTVTAALHRWAVGLHGTWSTAWLSSAWQPLGSLRGSLLGAALVLLAHRAYVARTCRGLPGRHVRARTRPARHRRARRAPALPAG